MNTTIIIQILGLNILTQLLLFGFNNMKSSSDSPGIFKLVTYFTAYSVNIIAFVMIIFYQKVFSEAALIAYIIATTALFAIHFIFDEDWLFRFEKGVVLATMMPLTLIFYGVLTILMF